MRTSGVIITFLFVLTITTTRIKCMNIGFSDEAPVIIPIFSQFVFEINVNIVRTQTVGYPNS